MAHHATIPPARSRSTDAAATLTATELVCRSRSRCRWGRRFLATWRARSLSPNAFARKGTPTRARISATYLNANGVPRDLSRGAALVRKGCEKGDDVGCTVLAYVLLSHALPDADSTLVFDEPCKTPAQCTLIGAKYLGGSGVAKDGPHAARLFEQACGSGYMSACFLVGVTAATAGGSSAPDFARAATFYTRACDGGQSIACHELGVLYASGKGVLADKVKASELYDRACRAGSIYSCMNLGTMYLVGDGVARDVSRSIAPLGRACGGGLPQACTNLGVLYAAGSGIAKDDVRAKTYFESACAAGDASGCKDRDVLAQCQQGSAEACAAFQNIKGVP
jgi:TPR repeat protein